MEIHDDLLSIKQLTSDQKLVLSIVMGKSAMIINIGCHIPAGNIGKLIGMTRTKVMNILWELDELGLITTIVQDRERDTKTTPLFKRLITSEKLNKKLIID